MAAPPRAGRGNDRYRPLLKSLLAGLLVLLLAFAFVGLGSEVAEGETRAFDTQLLHVAQSLRASHPGLAAAMRDLSAMGGTTMLTLFTLGATAYLALLRAWASALLVPCSAISGTIVVSLFKSAFGRARPDPAFADMAVAGMSFPSGHASMSAIVFLTLAVLVAARRANWPERSFILVAATLMTLLVGLSRVALGVHWATDVLGGWAFGTVWALGWLLLDWRLDRWHASPRGGSAGREPV